MSTRMQVLKMVEDGQISADEAMQLLAALNGSEPGSETGSLTYDELEPSLDQTEPIDEATSFIEVESLEKSESVDAPETETEQVQAPQVGSWWLIPIIAGAVVMAIGAPLMALGLTGSAHIFWALFCGWGPFMTGLFILTLGVWSRNAPWLHLRITNAESGKRTFGLSLPLPLTLTAWMLRIARPFVPQFKETGVDEAILALREGLEEMDKNQPLYIDVQDDEDGEHVQIYIG